MGPEEREELGNMVESVSNDREKKIKEEEKWIKSEVCKNIRTSLRT